MIEVNSLNASPSGVYLKERFGWTADGALSLTYVYMIHEAADEARQIRRRLGRAITTLSQELEYIADSLMTNGKPTPVWTPIGSTIQVEDSPKLIAQSLDRAEKRVLALLQRMEVVEREIL